MFSAYLPTRMDRSYYPAFHPSVPHCFDPRIAGWLLLSNKSAHCRPSCLPAMTSILGSRRASQNLQEWSEEQEIEKLGARS